MLAVPVKVSETIDFVTPLSTYISDKYTNISEDSYTSSLTSLNQLRTAALTPDTTSQDPAEQEKQRQKLYQYYAQICSMQSKFPISASSSDVKMSFKWKDAFKPSKSLTQHSLAYERAAMLFNIGAVYTLHGLNADTSNGGYTKNAAKLFMYAAGVYTHLRNNVATRVGGALTSDLSQEGLQMIIELMQAQAQALYYQKCVETPAARLTKGNEKKKNILCSKLAQKAVELYTLARQQLETPTLKAIVNKAWNEHITYQIHVFMAMSQYKQSEVDHETAEENAEGYGIELGRLAYAERQCTLALTLATQLKMTEQKEGATSLLSKISSRYRERKTDNDSIYLELEMKENELPKIGSQTMAKIIVPPELVGADRTAGTKTAFSTGGPNCSFLDLFSEMISPEVILVSSKYSSQLSTMCNEVSSEAEAATQAVVQQLAKIGLPGSVEASTNTKGIPETVWNKVKEVKDIGGQGKLDIMLGAAQQANSEILQLLTSIDNDLNAEEKQDREYRSEQTGNWNGVVMSDELTRDMRHDHGNYLKLLRDASGSDALVETLITNNRRTVASLSVTRAQLDASMPQTSASVAAKVAPVRNELVALLKELNVLLKNRTTAVANVRLSISEDDITNELVRNGCGVPVEALEAETKEDGSGSSVERWSTAKEQRIFKENLQKHESKKMVVYSNMSKQSSLFEQIQQKNAIFVRTKEDNATTRKREQIIHSINTSVIEYHDMYSKLKQGQQFYGDLRQRVDQLRQTVAGHVHGRALEARELLLNIRRQGEMALQSEKDQQYAQDMAAPPAPLNMGGGNGAGATPTAPPTSFSSNVPTYVPPSNGQLQNNYHQPPTPLVHSSSASSTSGPPKYGAPPPNYDAPPPLYSGNSSVEQYNNTVSHVNGVSTVGQPSYNPSIPAPSYTPVETQPSMTSGTSSTGYGGGNTSSSVRVGAGWGGNSATPMSSTPSYGNVQPPPPSYGGGGGGGGGQYAAELSQLSGMGFNDRSKNISLLTKHGGNLQAAVAELL